jgi:predicted RNA binding protein YcfA (HicA-like mRNA interferase family)
VPGLVAEGRSIQNATEIAQGLVRKIGFSFDRPGPGSHEVRRHDVSGRKVTLPHHARDFAEGTLRAILREAGIDAEVQAVRKIQDVAGG